MMNLRIVSTMGLTEEDVREIQNLDGVEEGMRLMPATLSSLFPARILRWPASAAFLSVTMETGLFLMTRRAI